MLAFFAKPLLIRIVMYSFNTAIVAKFTVNVYIYLENIYIVFISQLLLLFQVYRQHCKYFHLNCAS